MPAEQQVVLASGGLQLVGMLYRAEDPRATFVFCNPIFEERKSAHRALVESARAFASSGFNVLTFDYRGCGDSPGNFRDFAPADWLVDIAAAIATANTLTDASASGLLGLRVGGALAATAAADPANEVSCAVLWEPVTSGVRYVDQELRKKLTKEMVTLGKSKVSRTELIAMLQRGDEIDFDGYPFSSRLYNGLIEVDLLEIGPSISSPILIASVVHQNRQPPEAARLVDTLPMATGMVIVQQPFWNLTGYTDCSSLIDRTIHWVKDKYTDGSPSGDLQ